MVSLSAIYAHAKPIESPVLDIGCQEGDWCNYLQKKGHMVTGIEATRNRIQVARKRYPEILFACIDPYEFLSHMGGPRYMTITLFHSLNEFKELIELIDLMRAKSNRILIISQDVPNYTFDTMYRLDCPDRTYLVTIT